MSSTLSVLRYAVKAVLTHLFYAIEDLLNPSINSNLNCSVNIIGKRNQASGYRPISPTSQICNFKWGLFDPLVFWVRLDVGVGVGPFDSAPMGPY